MDGLINVDLLQFYLETRGYAFINEVFELPNDNDLLDWEDLYNNDNQGA